MPDITRLFKGPTNEFEVEVVYANDGDPHSPRESHPYEEILFLVAGSIDLELENEDGIRSLKPNDLVVIPAGTIHVIYPKADGSKFLIIHKERHKNPFAKEGDEAKEVREITRLSKGPKDDFVIQVNFTSNGQSSPRETHEYDEIALLLGGSITAELNGKRKEMKPNDLVFVPAGTEHLYHTKATPSKSLLIHPNFTGKM